MIKFCNDKDLLQSLDLIEVHKNQRYDSSCLLDRYYWEEKHPNKTPLETVVLLITMWDLVSNHRHCKQSFVDKKEYLSKLLCQPIISSTIESQWLIKINNNYYNFVLKESGLTINCQKIPPKHRIFDLCEFAELMQLENHMLKMLNNYAVKDRLKYKIKNI